MVHPAPYKPHRGGSCSMGIVGGPCSFLAAHGSQRGTDPITALPILIPMPHLALGHLSSDISGSSPSSWHCQLCIQKVTNAHSPIVACRDFLAGTLLIYKPRSPSPLCPVAHRVGALPWD